MLNLRSGPRWLPGIVIDVMQRSYYVQVNQDVHKRHEDQLRPRSLEMKRKPETESTQPTKPTLLPLLPTASVPSAIPACASQPTLDSPQDIEAKDMQQKGASEMEKVTSPQELRRNPPRQRTNASALPRIQTLKQNKQTNKQTK